MTQIPRDVAATVEFIERVVAEGAPAEVAEIVGQLERLKFLAWNREHRQTVAVAAPHPDNQDRYLTISEVAARLGLSKSYCYELGRRGILPVTALGTTGERSRAFRIKLSELTAWETALRKDATGVGLSNMLSSTRDGNGVPQAAAAPRDDTGTARRAARRPSDYPVAVGTRPGPRPGSRRATAGAAEPAQAEGSARRTE
jgi:excisionase family DNA binding protein